MNKYSEQGEKLDGLETIQNYNKLQGIGVFLFTFYYSTLHTFLYSSVEIYTVVLFVAIILLILSYLISYKDIIFTLTDTMWILFFTIFLINILSKGIRGFEIFFDLCVYLLCILFIILTKVSLKEFQTSFKFIKVIAVIFAMSAIFQFLNTDIYSNLILPLFSSHQQGYILDFQNQGVYTGFTDQPAYLAGYIVNGIGILIFLFPFNSKKVFNIILLLLLIIGLILTAKRAHFLFTIMAILITFLYSAKNQEIVYRFIKTIVITFVVLFFSSIAIYFSQPEGDSPLGKFTNKIVDTINGVLVGEDITSGRSILYDYAWGLFIENPIFGIGWKEFMNQSAGLISSGSHPHNIYLQLLTELGIIGFVFFIIPLTFTYYISFRMLRKLINKSITFNKDYTWKNALQISLYLQTFFILYGMTGNLLTDYNFLLMYFFACSISISAAVGLKKQSI
jgi:O-antigen ligase